MATDPWADFLPGTPQPAANDPWAEFAPAKPREWKDVPLEALKNAAPSAVNLVKNLVQPVLHPIDTAKALGDVAAGFISKTGRPGDLRREGDAEPTPEELQRRATVEAPADAVGQFFKDRYGSGEGIKNTLATDPVGTMADIASLLTPAAAATRGTAVGGQIARIASAIDPVVSSARGVTGAARLAEPVVSNALGFGTGGGTEGLRAIARGGYINNEALPRHLRGAPASEMVDMAQDAMTAERQQRSQNYNQGMAPVRADTTVLNFGPIDQAAARAAQVGTFEGVPLKRSTAETQGRITDILNEWRNYPPDRFHTAGGLDALKQAIGDVRDSTPFGTPSRVYADQVYRAVGNEVRAQAPTYANTMDAYRTASDQLNELTKTFSLGEKATNDTAIRKLASVMRNNVQTNYGERTRLMDVLAQHQPDLPYAIAGQAYNSALPRGLVARAGGAGTAAAALHFLDPSLLALGALQTPRIVGEATYLAARGAGTVGRTAEALGVNAPNVNTANAVAMQSGRVNSQEIQRRLALLLMRANEQGAR